LKLEYLRVVGAMMRISLSVTGCSSPLRSIQVVLEFRIFSTSSCTLSASSNDVLFVRDLLNAFQVDAGFIRRPDNFVQQIADDFVAVRRDCPFSKPRPTRKR
jgi:hypothetical protein